MDKYEFNIKVEQIKKLVSKSDYDTAMKIADTIDWRRVRNTNLLSMVAMIYEKNEDYEEAKEILLLAFERAPIGKRLLYKLAELALKEGNVAEAEAYYREFCDLASDDPRQQLLRYLILKAKGAPAQQLIHSLESYTSEELDEKWLYELAELYSLAGMADRCVETCDRIMLMFGLGKYVDKAMELKIEYAPLTKYQMDLVENRDKYEAKLRAVEQEYSLGTRRAVVAEPEEEDYDEDDGQNYEGQNYGRQNYRGDGYEDENYDDRGYENGEYGSDQYNSGNYNNSNYDQENYDNEDYNNDGYEDDNYSDNGQVTEEENLYDAQLAATFQEEEVRANLAKEMTRMAVTEEAAYEESPVREQEPSPTRVLDDIRRVNRPSAGSRGAAGRAGAAVGTAAGVVGAIGAAGAIAGAASMPRPHGIVRIPEPIEEISPEPVIEEDAFEEDNRDQNYLGGRYEEAGEDEAGARRSDSSKADAQNFGYESKDVPDMPEQQEDPLDIQDLEEDDIEEPLAWNHLMVECRSPEKGLELAVEALKQIHKETGLKNPVAKISGSKLANRGVLASKEKLSGKDLIIEEAGDMTEASLKELNQLMEQDTTGIIVVLIDNPKQLEALHREHPELASKFECIGCQDPYQFKEVHKSAKVMPLHPRQDRDLAHEPSVGSGVSADLAAAESIISYDSRSQDTQKEADYVDEGDYQDGGSYGFDDDGEEARYEDAPARGRKNTGYADSYEAEDYGTDEDYEDEPAPKEKKGLFGRKKQPVYEVMEPEDSDYEEFYEEERPSVRDQNGPGYGGEEMDIDEFAQYACKYANEIDCSITGKSMLALYERIEILEEDGVALTRENAEDLIEEAADRAEKPSMGKRLKGMFSSKYDKDGLLILKEEHFIY